MKYRILIFAVFFCAVMAWPPIYSFYLEREVKAWLTGQGRMEDFELQQLLDAQRWIIDIPSEKSGWILALESESKGNVKTSGGCSVTGGGRIVLLTRRNRSSKRIEYSWYQTQSRRTIEKDGPLTFTMNLTNSCSGSVDDPLESVGVTSGRPDGLLTIGEPIYRGGRSSVTGFSSPEKADYEVRVVLSPPYNFDKEGAK